MKKSIALILVLCTLCSVFAGCKSKKSGTSGEGFTFPSNEQENTSATAKPAAPTEAPTQAPVTEPDKEYDPDTYVPGVKTDNYWGSEFMGLAFYLPKGFYMADDEYLSQLMQVGMEAVFGEDGEFLLDYVNIYCVYEMMAQDTRGNNVIVMAEKNLRNYSVDAYADALTAQLLSISGIDYTLENRYDVTFAGMEFTCLDLVADYGSAIVYQRYLLQAKGDRIIGLIISAQDSESRDTVQNYFEAY